MQCPTAQCCSVTASPEHLGAFVLPELVNSQWEGSAVGGGNVLTSGVHDQHNPRVSPMHPWSQSAPQILKHYALGSRESSLATTLANLPPSLQCVRKEPSPADRKESSRQVGAGQLAQGEGTTAVHRVVRGGLPEKGTGTKPYSSQKKGNMHEVWGKCVPDRGNRYAMQWL